MCQAPFKAFLIHRGQSKDPCPHGAYFVEKKKTISNEYNKIVNFIAFCKMVSSV